MEQVKKLESNQEKPDKKGKGKAPKMANLLARINEEIPLIDRMEDIDNYNERVFITLESDKTNKVVQMDVDDEIVSLGDDDVYEDARQFYADNDILDGNYTKYSNGLLYKKLAKIPHTVKTMGERVKIPSLSRHYSSSTVETTTCAKGKMHNKPFPPSEKRALKPFNLIHADLIELPIRSYHKKKWVCMLMDDYSSYAYCFLLRSKEENLCCYKTVLRTGKDTT